MRIQWLKREWLGLSLVFLAWLIFFGRTLFAGQIYFLDDLKIIFYPLEVAYAQAQGGWQLPLWNNLFGFGQPLIAWAQLGFFTPLHLLLRLLQVPPLILLQTSILIYFGLGLLGMYVFLRAQRLNLWAAVLGAALFTFSGFNIGHLNHVNFYVGTMLLPWLLLALFRFTAKPTLMAGLTVSLLSSIIALSSQPQVTLYTLIIAALYGIVRVAAHCKLFTTLYSLHIISFVLLAGLIFFGLASFSILPLREFIPITERSAGIDPFVLYEFSYPPWHAITLIAPYFYGDHAHYFGAKGFQELAAFTGIVPLVLAGVALTSWRRFRTERLFACIVCLIGISGALGIYSPLYTLLVEQHYLRSVAIPGRFVFFFLMGIALLAALGIDTLQEEKTRQAKILSLLSGLLVPVFLFAPFVYRVSVNLLEYQRLQEIIASEPITWLLPLLGLIIFCALFIPRLRRHAIPSLVIISGATLIIYAWNYNPLIPYRDAALPGIAATLKAESAALPPRLYSRPQIFTAASANQATLTESLAPNFHIRQQLVVTPGATGCFRIPMETKEPGSEANIVIGVQRSPEREPVRTITLGPAQLSTGRSQRLCFPEVREPSQGPWFLSITATEASTTSLYRRGTENNDEQAYFIRVPTPTAEELARSRKPFMIVVEQERGAAFDPELSTLSRHLNAAAEASSARWIGALSIGSYREFIETFFANDKDDFVDGDGVHILARHRKLLNMAGVTHLAQHIETGVADRLPSLGFTIQQEDAYGDNGTTRLYRNPEAFPKAFFVPHAILKAAADETRTALFEPAFDPQTVVYISGETPPPAEALIDENSPFPTQHAIGEATITRYENTLVEVDTNNEEPAWLVLSDATTPEWHSLIDGQPVPSYRANSVFKAAYVPSGAHRITFYYRSPAIERAKRLTLLSLSAVAVLFLLQPARMLLRRFLPIR